MDIFKEASIAGIKLKNRIIRSATHELVSKPGIELKEIYTKLAFGGAGAIITGLTGINPDQIGFSKMPLLCTEEECNEWSNFLKDLAPYKTPIILQLTHSGGKSIGKNAQSPSPYKYYFQESNEMTEEQIIKVINDFTTSIELAKSAGFDGVQIQASHGYLLSEFLSPKLNRRTDIWGGNTENRFRIIKEIILESRKKVKNFPILAKISAYDTDEEGTRIDESIKIAKLLEGSGCDAIEISCGNLNGFDTIRSKKPPVEMILNLPNYKNLSSEKKQFAAIGINKNFIRQEIENYNVEAASKIKSAVSIPVIVVGGIRELDKINGIINTKKADFVSMSRPFIIEPDIVNRFKNGQKKSSCINCAYCIPGFTDKLKCLHGKFVSD